MHMWILTNGRSGVLGNLHLKPKWKERERARNLMAAAKARPFKNVVKGRGK